MAPNINFDQLLQYEDSDADLPVLREESLNSEEQWTDALLVVSKGHDDDVTPQRQAQEERSLTRAMWKKLNHLNQKCNSERLVEILEDLKVSKKIQQALSSIRILHDEITNRDWLDAVQAELYELSEDTLQTIADLAPQAFSARVADFNDNLWYEMQSRRGLDQWGLDWDLTRHVDALGSYLQTEATVSQPAHVDYTWDVLEDPCHSLWIGFGPLTREGMFLQVWPRQDDSSVACIPGQVIHIPYGRLLIVPAATIHGGGFRTTPPCGEGVVTGNLRFHLYLARETESHLLTSKGSLPMHQTNKYTEPHDKRRELCERYVDAPHMGTLQNCLFV